MGESVFDWKGRPFNCFGCLGARPEEGNAPTCMCCSVMIMDAALVCQRGLKDLDAVLQELKRFREEHALAHASAINFWLEGSPSTPVTSMTETRYVPEEYATSMPVRLGNYLGERDEVKTWLAGCLLKTLKSNQRWHERTELIDGFPEITSWLRSIAR